MSYSQIIKQNNEDIASVPMFFAFNIQQLSEGIDKFNAEEKDLISIPGGGFMLKEDKHLLTEAFDRCEARIAEFMSTDEGLISALRYELANYEYDGDPTEALMVLGLNINDQRVQRCLPQAINQLEMSW